MTTASALTVADAALTYVSDQQPGLRRRRAETGFSYRDRAGERITDRRVVDRICTLAVPGPPRTPTSRPRTSAPGWERSSPPPISPRSNGRSPTERRSGSVTTAIEGVAEQLGNTPAVCRKGYVHPTVVDLFLAGDLQDRWSKASAGAKRGLRADEHRLLAVLRPPSGRRSAA